MTKLDEIGNVYRESVRKVFEIGGRRGFQFETDSGIFPVEIYNRIEKSFLQKNVTGIRDVLLEWEAMELGDLFPVDAKVESVDTWIEYLRGIVGGWPNEKKKQVGLLIQGYENNGRFAMCSEASIIWAIEDMCRVFPWLAPGGVVGKGGGIEGIIRGGARWRVRSGEK